LSRIPSIQMNFCDIDFILVCCMLSDVNFVCKVFLSLIISCLLLVAGCRMSNAYCLLSGVADVVGSCSCRALVVGC
jgi:hypothetical protein